MANDLIVIDEAKVPDLYSEKQIDDTLEKIKTFARSVVVGDVTTKEGSADIRTMAARVRSTKAAMVKAGEELSRDIKKKAKVQTDLIGEQVTKIETDLDALYTEIRKPLTEYEEKEKARKAKHEADCGVIAQALMFAAGTTSAQLTERITQIEALREKDWEEFEDIAEKLFDDKLPELIKHRDSLILTEGMAAENARLKKEAEDRKAEDDRRAAEEKQKTRDAELLIEADHREHALAAGGWDDRIKVADKAKKDEQDRQQRETKRLEEEEKVRKDNKEHADKLTSEAVYDLINQAGLFDDHAAAVVRAIVDGKVRHVTIKF